MLQLTGSQAKLGDSPHPFSHVENMGICREDDNNGRQGKWNTQIAWQEYRDSFISRLDLADRNYHRLHPLRPTFDRDDPFTGKDNADSFSLFTLPSNGSSVILQNIEFDDGVELPEIIHSGIEFDAEKNALGFEDNGNDDDDDESKGGDDEENGFSQQYMNLRFFITLFVPGYYLLTIVGFTVLYSCISGIVFVVVANDLLGRHDSCISEVVWVGAKVGVKKLTWFFCLRWAVRNAESHGIGLLFVPRIYDQYFLFKLFIWLKLIPFSIVFPWFFELERYMPMYFLLWWALDEVVVLVMALDCWITIDSSRRTGFEIMKEGYDLISRMWHQAVLIKCYEHVIVEGTAAIYHLSRVLGEG
ncbi:hypothetical protein NC652_029363 [Populus alba x Populus x berolinensis]|nr:hypothetical protein NC652_029363 [Populus alba x Populus x berolinensis]